MEDLIKNCHNFFPEYYVRSFELGDFEKEGMCVDYDYPTLQNRKLPLLDYGLMFFGNRSSKKAITFADNPKKPSSSFLSELAKQMLFGYPEYRYGIGKTLNPITGKHNVPYIWFYKMNTNV